MILIHENVSTLYTLKSVCKFSTLFSIHFLSYKQGEFVEQSRASSVGDHFLFSYDFKVWFRGDIVRRNNTLVTPTCLRVNGLTAWLNMSMTS